MTVNCGLCGKKIIVADNLSDGQHICCPHCKGELEYRMPVASNGISNKNVVPERLKLKHKPKNYIAGLRAFYYLAAIIVAGVAIAVIMMMNGKQEEESSRQVVESQQKEVERQSSAQEKPIANPEEGVRKLAEEEATEKATEKATAKEEIVDEEEDKMSKQEVLQKRREVLDQIRIVKFDYFQNCPEDERPLSPKANMTYVCIIPKLGKKIDVLELIASSGKEIEIIRYTDEGPCFGIIQKVRRQICFVF